VLRLSAEKISLPRNVTIDWWDMEIIANLLEKRNVESHQKQQSLTLNKAT
jgi:hypothetical protein